MPVLLMTRPTEDSDRFVAGLGALHGVQVVTSPLICIRVAKTIAMPSPEGIIFTSSNGVRAASQLGVARGPAFCVGTRTTEKARAAGWDALQAGETADQLVEKLSKLRPNAPLVHLRGKHVRGEIAQRLTEQGLATFESILYEQDTLPLSAAALDVLKGNRLVIVPLFSPRTARQFADTFEGNAHLSVVAMSNAVADSVKHLKYHDIVVSDAPTAQAMTRCVRQLIDDACRVEGVVGAQ